MKVALRHTTVFAFSSFRWVVAGAILLFLSALRASERTDRRPLPLKRVVIAAVVGIVINQIGFTEAVRYTTATDVSLIVGATPLIVALWLAVATDETVPRALWGVLAVGGLGLALVVFGGGDEGGTRHVPGELFAVLTLVSWSAYIILVSDLLRSGASLQLSGTVSLLGGMMLLVPGIPDLVSGGTDFSLELLGLFAFSAVVATAFATSAYYAALRRLGSARLATFQYLQPFVGVLTAWIVLGERLTVVQLLGGAIVMLALWRTPRRAGSAKLEHPEPIPRA